MSGREHLAGQKHLCAQKRLRAQKRRSRKKRIRQCVRMAAALAVCLAGIWLFGSVLLGEGSSVEISDKLFVSDSQEMEMPGSSAGEDAFPDRDIDLTQLYSPYAVLLDLSSQTEIAEHNSRERIYPASLTKIMTAIVAIENLPDLTETITLPTKMFGMLYIRHASVAGFEPEEAVTVKDLLYGIMLPSGAECCIACADRIAGSEEAFVELMNEKAAKLGLQNTHFCNSTGLHEERHYSTAQDIARLLRYALENDIFREIFCSGSYTSAATGAHPEGITFESTMFKYLGSASVTGGTILGGKTGYTKEAGLCLASLANIGGRDYILVTAGADGSHDTEAFHVLDAKSVYEQIGAAYAAP